MRKFSSERHPVTKQLMCARSRTTGRRCASRGAGAGAATTATPACTRTAAISCGPGARGAPAPTTGCRTARGFAWEAGAEPYSVVKIYGAR